MSTPSKQSRIRGCIVGGALGDAIGLFTEFLNREGAIGHYGTNPRFSLSPEDDRNPEFVTMFMDRHRAMFEEGGFTDDTDQSLLILMSFLRSPHVPIDPDDFARRIKFWVQYGFRPLDRLPLGLGRTVGSVVRSAEYLDDPIAYSRVVWDKSGRNLAANGAVMRTAVIGTFTFPGDDWLNQTIESAMSIASTTHADPRCLVSSAIISSLVAAIIRNEVKDDSDIRRVVDSCTLAASLREPDPLSTEHIGELHQIIWNNDLDALKLDQRESIGYTYKCLASGIWALRQGILALGSDGTPAAFEKIITELTMAAGDADTNCAVAGPLLGALFGLEGLPSHWLKGLKHRDWLLAKADAVLWLVLEEQERTQYPEIVPYNSEEDVDTLIDGGKGEMTKGELDDKWKVVTENMHQRTGDGDKLQEWMKRKVSKRKECTIC